MAESCEEKTVSSSAVAYRTWRHRLQWRILRRKAWLGYRIYGSYGPRTVRIGPHTMLKWGHDVDVTEADAMHFIAQHTDVPVPQVYESWKYGRITVLKMQYIKGKQAGGPFGYLTDAEQDEVCAQLKKYVEEIRALVPPSPSQVSATLGGPCRDHRFGIKAIGPFENHDDFHTFLRTGDDLSSFQSWLPEVVSLHSGTYTSNFTHGDLAPRNVIIRDGRIAAIIDWDSAGWRPGYWEYTKSHYSVVPNKWLDALKEAAGKYEHELEGEAALWRAEDFPADPVTYPHLEEETSEQNS